MTIDTNTEGSIHETVIPHNDTKTEWKFMIDKQSKIKIEITQAKKFIHKMCVGIYVCVTNHSREFNTVAYAGDYTFNIKNAVTNLKFVDLNKFCKENEKLDIQF